MGVKRVELNRVELNRVELNIVELNIVELKKSWRRFSRKGVELVAVCWLPLLFVPFFDVAANNSKKSTLRECNC